MVKVMVKVMVMVMVKVMVKQLRKGETMRVLFQIDTGPGKKTSGLEVFTAEWLKTKTKLSLLLDNVSTLNPTLEMSTIREDIHLLDLSGPVKVTLLVEGILNFGRMFNRCVDAFQRIGISVSPPGVLCPPLDWECSAGTLEIIPRPDMPLYMTDLPELLSLLARLCERAVGNMTATQRPLKLYDVMQTAGLMHSEDREAAEIKTWIEVRELVILQELEADLQERKRANRRDRHRKGQGKGATVTGKAKTGGTVNGRNPTRRRAKG